MYFVTVLLNKDFKFVQELSKVMYPELLFASWNIHFWKHLPLDKYLINANIRNLHSYRLYPCEFSGLNNLSLWSFINNLQVHRKSMIFLTFYSIRYCHLFVYRYNMTWKVCPSLLYMICLVHVRLRQKYHAPHILANWCLNTWLLDHGQHISCPCNACPNTQQ